MAGFWYTPGCVCTASPHGYRCLLCSSYYYRTDIIWGHLTIIYTLNLLHHLFNSFRFLKKNTFSTFGIFRNVTLGRLFSPSHTMEHWDTSTRLYSVFNYFFGIAWFFTCSWLSFFCHVSNSGSSSKIFRKLWKMKTACTPRETDGLYLNTTTRSITP